VMHRLALEPRWAQASFAVASGGAFAVASCCQRPSCLPFSKVNGDRVASVKVKTNNSNDNDNDNNDQCKRVNTISDLCNCYCCLQQSVVCCCCLLFVFVWMLIYFGCFVALSGCLVVWLVVLSVLSVQKCKASLDLSTTDHRRE
jgi:hypothetical protein